MYICVHIKLMHTQRHSFDNCFAMFINNAISKVLISMCMHSHCFIHERSDGSCQICVYLVGDLDVLVAEAWSRPGWMRFPGLSEYTWSSCTPSWP